MPAIKKIARSEMFNMLNSEAYARNETNDCSVKAIALACNVSYSTAKEVLAKFGRKDRRGAYTHDILAAARALGFTVTPVDIKAIVNTYPEPHRSVLKGITTHHPRRFNKVWPKGNYLMFVPRHVAAVVDGQLHDWTINQAKRCTFLYKVEKVA